jgi:hypothetical protein
MGSEQKLWDDMIPTEKLAAIRELAEQVQALKGDNALRHKIDKEQPIQLRPSVCSRRDQAFLLSAASPLDHPAAHFNLSQYPAWNFASPPKVTQVFAATAEPRPVVAKSPPLGTQCRQRSHSQY